MYTDRPVPSVDAGTVTLNTSVTVRSSAVPDTDADGAERLNDVSSATHRGSARSRPRRPSVSV